MRTPRPDAVSCRIATTWRAVSLGFAAQTLAAAAETTGAANDVPSSPSAAIETQGPVFEKGAWVPSRRTAATASPFGPSSAAGYSGRLA